MYPHHRNAIPRHNSSSSIINNNSTKTANLAMIRSCSADVQPFMNFSYSSSLDSFSSSSSNVAADAFPLPLVVGRAWGGGARATTAATTAAKPFRFFFNPFSSIASMFRSIVPSLQSFLIPTCQLLATTPNPTASLSTSRAGRRRRLTGTFFGQKKGRVSFAVQETPRSDPILLLELATPTAHLVREMASGTVRILLECERSNHGDGGAKKGAVALLDEPMWTMYCNGHKLGYAASRRCTPSDSHVLSVVEAVSVGAGVIPAATAPLALPPPRPTEVVGKHGHDGHQVMYMRAKFERVTGSRDSEAFYMINPDCRRGGGGGREGSGGAKHCNGGPELSIFLLRI
ncbi:protein MIZU-KUSSEI 1-like [Iris pallida]|uniref:Protein MIZU-KUSSEI 1-like n=1 Tax=Iris pallida TaxID=29817 RepID=A0AAX6DR22_IRIPA|nr:protein MIZU-KUSSEI 1-like [Iris pallida]